MRYRQSRKPRKFIPSCVPSDVARDGVLWAPDWTEIELERARARQAHFENELRARELTEQRDWLIQQGQRLAQIAAELDEYKQLELVAAEQEKRFAWWADVQDREKEINAKLMEHYQDQLDGGVHAAMVARADKAKADMDRDNARLERLAEAARGWRLAYQDPHFRLTRSYHPDGNSIDRDNSEI